ncbi:MAG: hypothetical protein HYT88_05645 [Candidatus Omnitrophica bacterium]|nr:hypothetical protein [Candidatus Omnitrophota bacterium]MBI2174878.1 hypothetical protein [Candidatus Omnitrophota bacterium]MBI3009512.1 hypothetical protein [Candidatus Omnitrophota bacterium]
MKHRRRLWLVGVAVLVANVSSVGSVEQPSAPLTAEDILAQWTEIMTGPLQDALLTTYPSIYPFGILPKFNLEAVQLIAPTRALIRFEGQHDFCIGVLEGSRSQNGSLRFAVVRLFEPVPKLLPPDTVSPRVMQGYRQAPTKGPLALSQDEWEAIRAGYGDSTFTPKSYTWRLQRFEEVHENAFTLP